MINIRHNNKQLSTVFQPANRVPKALTMIDIQPNVLILDYGCGSIFDKYSLPYVKERNGSIVGYDPYCRTKEQNAEALQIVEDNGGAQVILLSNVLNNIDDEEERTNVLRNCYDLVKASGRIFISIYEGDRTGVPKIVKRNEQGVPISIQLNKKKNEYISEIEQFFEIVAKKDCVFIVRPR